MMSDETLRNWRAAAIQKIRDKLAAHGFHKVEEEVYFNSYIATGIKIYVKNNVNYSIHLDDEPRVEFHKKR